MSDWLPTRDLSPDEAERARRHAEMLASDPEFKAQVERVQAAVDSGDLSSLGPSLTMDELRQRYSTGTMPLADTMDALGVTQADVDAVRSDDV